MMVVALPGLYGLQGIGRRHSLVQLVESQGDGSLLLSQVEQPLLTGCLSDPLDITFAQILQQFLPCSSEEITLAAVNLKPTVLKAIVILRVATVLKVVM